MPAKGILLLRVTVFCGMGFIAGHAALGQFLESPDTNLFGGDFVKTFDVRAGGVLAGTQRRGKKPVKLEGYEHLLLFKDGRQIRGRMESAGKDEIVWKRPDFSEPLHLPRADVRHVYLTPNNANGANIFAPGGMRFIPGRVAGRRGVARNAVVPATVKLGGNDWLRGGVTSPDGQSFILSLDNRGSSITMPRSQVEWLFFDLNPTTGGGFDGSMQGAEEWLASAPSASLAEDGTLVIAGQNEWFGRLLPQPTRFEISMEIPADSESGPHLWLQPSYPSPNTFTPGAVDVGFGPKNLALRRFTTAMEQKSVPVSEPAGQGAKGMTRYRIFYDSDKQRLVIFRNGRNMVDWNPEEPKAGGPAKDTIRPELLTYLMRMSFRNTMEGATISAAISALQPTGDGFCMASIPDLLATASHCQFAAQLIVSELRSRFPRINSISLTGGPKGGDENKPLLKLHRFEVSPWDGVLPREGDVPATEDQLSSAALGSIAGKLESITEKDVLFSQQTQPKLPGTLIRLPHESSAPFDVVARAGFGAAGELSVSSLEIRDGTAHLRTAFAEDLALPLTALNVISFPSPELHSPPNGASLVFKNGDELPGSLISATHDAPLRWKMPGGQEVAIEFQNIAGVQFAAAAPAKPRAESAFAELRNGDRLRGAVVSFDEHRLGFKEPVLGSLSVDRSHIWNLFPEAGAKIRDGTDDPAGWMSAELRAGPFLYVNPKQNKTDPQLAWLYFDGCYLPKPVARQNGGMEVTFLSSHVPRQNDGLFEVRADIAGVGGNMPSAIVTIGGKQNENGSSSAISINFSGTEIYVNAVSSNGGQTSRQVAFGEKLGKISTRLSFRIFVNSLVGTADVMLDGALVARIGQQATERAPGIDQAVQFGGFSYDGHPMVFSNLWIGPWDGELPRAETAGKASTSLANGDVAASVPSALKDGKYLLESEVGPLRLPAASVSAIAFGGESAQTHSAARLWLADGSVVHVASFEFQDGALAGHSEVLGDLHLPLESLAEIVFDPEPLRAPIGPPLKNPAQPAAAAGPAKLDEAP